MPTYLTTSTLPNSLLHPTYLTLTTNFRGTQYASLIYALRIAPDGTQHYGQPNIGVCPHSTLDPTDLKKNYHKILRAIRRKRGIN